MKVAILSLFFITCTATAARLDDVKILNVTPGNDNFQLKLQMRNGDPDSFFYVEITKKDPDSFEKLGHIMKKVIRKRGYRLDLNIPSFSASPSGSRYRSEDVLFLGAPSDSQFP